MEPYRDHLGRERPADGLYVGNLPRGRVVRWDASGRTAKIVHQSEAGTTVSVVQPDRTFTTAAGKTVRIRGARKSKVLARGTIVWPARPK